MVNKNFFCFPRQFLTTVAAIYCRINRRVQTWRFLWFNYSRRVREAAGRRESTNFTCSFVLMRRDCFLSPRYQVLAVMVGWHCDTLIDSWSLLHSLARCYVEYPGPIGWHLLQSFTSQATHDHGQEIDQHTPATSTNYTTLAGYSASKTRYTRGQSRDN